MDLYWDGHPAAKIYDVVGNIAGSLGVSGCALCRVHFFRLVRISSNILLRLSLERNGIGIRDASAVR